MELGQRDTGAAGISQKLSDQRDSLLRAFSRAPARRELADERSGSMANFYKSLCLEIAVRLRDGGRIDAEFRGELPYRRERRSTAKCAGRDGQAHAIGNLHVKWDRTASINAVKHGIGLKFQCNGTV